MLRVFFSFYYKKRKIKTAFAVEFYLLITQIVFSTSTGLLSFFGLPVFYGKGTLH